jgi:hypothetical protein
MENWEAHVDARGKSSGYIHTHPHTGDDIDSFIHRVRDNLCLMASAFMAHIHAIHATIKTITILYI